MKTKLIIGFAVVAVLAASGYFILQDRFTTERTDLQEVSTTTPQEMVGESKEETGQTTSPVQTTSNGSAALTTYRNDRYRYTFAYAPAQVENMYDSGFGSVKFSIPYEARPGVEKSASSYVEASQNEFVVKKCTEAPGTGDFWRLDSTNVVSIDGISFTLIQKTAMVSGKETGRSQTYKALINGTCYTLGTEALGISPPVPTTDAEISAELRAADHVMSEFAVIARSLKLPR